MLPAVRKLLFLSTQHSSMQLDLMYFKLSFLVLAPIAVAVRHFLRKCELPTPKHGLGEGCSNGSGSCCLVIMGELEAVLA